MIVTAGTQQDLRGIPSNAGQPHPNLDGNVCRLESEPNWGQEGCLLDITATPPPPPPGSSGKALRVIRPPQRLLCPL